MQITKLGVAKFLVSGVVGIGTGKIVGSIIRHHVKPTTLIDKVSIAAATVVISAIASDRTKDYTNEWIDDLVGKVSEVKNQIQIQQKLQRINSNQSTFEDEGLDPSDFRQDENGKWKPIDVLEGEVQSA